LLIKFELVVVFLMCIRRRDFCSIYIPRYSTSTSCPGVFGHEQVFLAIGQNFRNVRTLVI
jgi:hypothetical protein